MINNQPLVSVGIPTYNRPEGLRRTLECITNQTYKTLQIIVSDNCSPNSKVEIIVKDFINKDNRITYYKQKENSGAANNFKFVLEKATGEYFMWAADDDEWDSSFISITVSFLVNNKNYIAVSTEAQYYDGHQKFDFFSEGKPFYKFHSDNELERLKYMLKYNYGNLVYGMYRLNILKALPIIFVKNEIPFLVQIIFMGNWKVLPEIRLYKKTNIYTYRQAKWEKVGGKLLDKRFNLNYLKELKNNYYYHKVAYKHIKQAINTLKLSASNKKLCSNYSYKILFRHYMNFVFLRKKPLFL